MAEFRQGYLDDYTQITSVNIGIGTSISNEKLEIIGGTTAQELDVTGISTFTHVSGFIKKHTDYTGNIDFDAGDSGTLSGEIIVGVGLTMTVGTAATVSQGSVDSLKVYNMFQPPSGGTSQRPPAKPGALFYNFDFKTIEFFDGNFWRQVDNVAGAGRGFIAGGQAPGPASVMNIDLINISSLGNAVHFGTNSSTGTSMRGSVGRASSRTDAFCMSDGSDATILYFTMSTQGNATEFAEQSFTGSQASLASSTRALTASNSNSSKAVDYIQMSTKANAIDFGDLTVGRNELGAVSSPTRGIFCGGGAPSGSAPQSTMDFFTIASIGNATTFGELADRRGQLGGGVSDGVRGVVAGGYDAASPYGKKTIDYMTIASTGNALSFGDLMVKRGEQAGAVCNRVRGIFCGGYVPGGKGNSMEYVTIASTGNGQDFGDLTQPKDRLGGGTMSDSHGGLGGF